ncbi:hypothetical protein Tco_0622476 [Tanacetum coccineum]
MVEEPVKMKKKYQISLDEELSFKLQAEEEEEERLAREKAQREEEANIVSWHNFQAMIDADYQMAQQMLAEEQEQLSIEENSKLFVQLLEARKKHFTNNQLKNKSFDDIHKLFDKAMKRVNIFVYMDTKLVEGSEVRAEGNDTRTEGSSKRAGEDLQQESIKKQKVDECSRGKNRSYQDKYVAEILKKFDLVNVKTAITPIETKVALTKDEEVIDVDVTPKTSHLNAVKRIFKYLKGKPHLGLWYPRESPFNLEAFSDSDYGRSNLDRKSTTVLLRKFDGEQLIVGSKSTTGLWFQFHEYQIHIDNESTICIVKNPSVSFQDKAHREYAPQFMKNRYEKKLIRVLEGHQDLLLPAAACCLLLIQVHVRTLEGLQSQPSSSTIPVPSTSLPPVQSPPPTPTPIPASTPTPIPEINPEPLER